MKKLESGKKLCLTEAHLSDKTYTSGWVKKTDQIHLQPCPLEVKECLYTPFFIYFFFCFAENIINAQSMSCGSVLSETLCL